MTALLIHLETHPDESGLLTLPPSHVFKMMFLHQQVSELAITQQGKPVGNLTLRPKTDAALNERSLFFAGGLSFTPPGEMRRQRITWDGELVMDRAFNMLRLHLIASIQDPPYRLHLEVDPAAKRADYELQLGTRLLKRSSIPLTQEGLGSLLRDELGIDPAVLQNMPVSAGSPTLTAKQTELKIRKENVVAYLLTAKSGETTLAEIYVSQLGQVLTAKTLVGYDLSAEDVTAP